MTRIRFGIQFLRHTLFHADRIGIHSNLHFLCLIPSHAGHTTGVYTDIDSAASQLYNVQGAKMSVFRTFKDADIFVKNHAFEEGTASQVKEISLPPRTPRRKGKQGGGSRGRQVAVEGVGGRLRGRGRRKKRGSG